MDQERRLWLEEAACVVGPVGDPSDSVVHGEDGDCADEAALSEARGVVADHGVLDHR